MLHGGSKSLFGEAVVLADSGHGAHALRLNEDLSFLARIRSDLIPVGIIGADEPFAIPACRLHAFDHAGLFFPYKGRLLRFADQLGDFRIVICHIDIHTGDKDALCNASIIVGDSLEALPRCIREAVEVEAIVPVRTSDEWQAMRAAVRRSIMEGTAQVLVKRSSQARIVVKIHLFTKDAHISRFLYIGTHRADEPERIIIESGADAHVPAFGQWLILMVRTAVRELRGCHIQNALPCTVRDEMDKAEKILGAVTEAHAASDTTFKIRR